jgi:Ca2+-binding RTX toxin-like protein
MWQVRPRKTLNALNRHRMKSRNAIRRSLETLEPRAMLAWKVLEGFEGHLVIGEPADGDVGVLSYDLELNEYLLDGVATGVEVSHGGVEADVVVRAGNAEGTTFVFDDREVKFPRGMSCQGTGCYPSGIQIEYDGGNRENNLSVASESQVRGAATEQNTGEVIISSSGRHRISYANLRGTLHFDGAALTVDARQTTDHERWVTVEAGSVKVRGYFPISVSCEDPPICLRMVAPTVVNHYDVAKITHANGRLDAIFTGDGNDRVTIASSFLADMNTRKFSSENTLRIGTGDGDDSVSIVGTADDDWIWLAEWPQGCPLAPRDPGFGLPRCESLSSIGGIADPFVPGKRIPRLVEFNFENMGGVRIHPQRQFARFQTIGVESHIVTGHEGNDILIGSEGADLIWGGSGDDKIVGRGGDDVVVGGSGTDSIAGGEGNDILIAGEMTPLGVISCSGVNGGFNCAIPFPSRWFGTHLFIIDPAIDTLGNDVLLGGAGDDEMFGSAGANTINGDAGNDVLIGGNGFDQLNGGLGRNVMIAGAGRDSVQSIGSDLIVTGSTIYDVDAEALREIRAEWTSTRSLPRRIANLTNGGSEDRANGDTFLNESTVLDDQEVDRVFSRRRVDWLLVGEGDQATFPGPRPRRGIGDALIRRVGREVEVDANAPRLAVRHLFPEHQSRRLERQR